MAFNQYVKVPDEVAKKLPFLGKPYYYVYRDSTGAVLRGLLYSVTRDNFNKAFKRLAGEQGEIVKGDKVYILPNCRIPMFKLKDYIKSVEATITPDVSEATKIIGHNKSKEEVGYHSQAMASSILVEGELNVKSHHKPEIRRNDLDEIQNVKDLFAETLNRAENVFEAGETTLEAIVDTIISPNVESVYEFQGRPQLYLITPTGIMILYNHIRNKTLIINEDSVYEKMGKPVVIDQDTYSSILDMMASPDDNNQRIGCELLANSDITPSLFYIWKLARRYSNTLSSFSKFKNVRLFIEMSEWQSLAGTDAEQAIELFYQKGVLNKEIFKELVNEASKKYVGVLHSGLFRMVLEPSEKFDDFKEPDQRFIYSREHNIGTVTQVEIVEDED